MHQLPVLASNARENPILFLVLRKFPGMDLQKLFGPADGRQIHELTARNREEAEAYAEYLRALSSDRLKVLYERERQQEARERALAFQREEASRFYNKPEAQAVVSYWAQKAYWTLDEAVALSLGKDPRHVTPDRMKPYTKIWPLAQEFLERRDTFGRAVVMGQLYHQTIPGIFLAWARRVGVSVPADLVAEVERLGVQVADWKTLFDGRTTALRDAEARAAELGRQLAVRDGELEAERSKRVMAGELGTRERDTLLKLILGLAHIGYPFDPKAKRLGIANEIAKDMQKRGLAISDDTVRKYLDEARDLFTLETDREAG